MKIKIVQTVEIDPAAWAVEFGLDPATLPAIKRDVESYFDNWLQAQVERLQLQPKENDS